MLECVVNVSEGRAGTAINALVDAAGDELLDLHVDPHHHRSVLTVLGEDAVRRVAAVAVAVIDLRRHTGAHPRLGAVDVVPFVALDEPASAAGAAADRYGRWSATVLRVPTFRYGAGHPDLPSVRRGAFRSLQPSSGPTGPHPTAGASAVGARPLLVAYNVWLAESDVDLARQIARAVRGPSVRALGLLVGRRVQVSMNLLQPSVVGPADAYDAVAEAARTVGGRAAGAELVGLLPAAVLAAAPERRWGELDLDADRTIEARLAARLSRGPRPR